VKAPASPARTGYAPRFAGRFALLLARCFYTWKYVGSIRADSARARPRRLSRARTVFTRRNNALQGSCVAPHAGAWIEDGSLSQACGTIGVAPHAGAWIETRSRVSLWRADRSRPMRARGSKLCARRSQSASHYVAPHAGAWIETSKCRADSPMARVAPHAGAWIETDTPMNAAASAAVAPHAGAWIETSANRRLSRSHQCRAPCGRVDRNVTGPSLCEAALCRAPCGRVDRNDFMGSVATARVSRAPCGRVDRNQDIVGRRARRSLSRPMRARGSKQSISRRSQ
jgi:hypothetical protein